MPVEVGSRIVIHDRKLGEPSRNRVVFEVVGSDVGAPYVVRWGDDGRESLFPHREAAVPTES